SWLFWCFRTTELATMNDEKAILGVIKEFLAAGDVQDTVRLAETLDPTFRIAINQFMGEPGVNIIDRASYLQLVGAKKLGGDPRTSKTINVEIVGNVAFVRAKVKNSQLQFDTLYVLAKDVDNRWWLVSETPYVTPIG
ncbi:MAG: hypothetical protein AAFU67_02205, partial [Bacteroidota bacterium]